MLPVYLGIPLILTDFLQWTWYPFSVGRFVNIRAILRCTGKSYTQHSSLYIKYDCNILRKIFFLIVKHIYRKKNIYTYLYLFYLPVAPQVMDRSLMVPEAEVQHKLRPRGQQEPSKPESPSSLHEM